MNDLDVKRIANYNYLNWEDIPARNASENNILLLNNIHVSQVATGRNIYIPFYTYYPTKYKILIIE